MFVFNSQDFFLFDCWLKLHLTSIKVKFWNEIEINKCDGGHRHQIFWRITVQHIFKLRLSFSFRLFKISYECNLNILLKSSSRNKMKQNRHRICPQKTSKHTHKQWIMVECEKDKSVKWCLKGRMFLEELRLWNKEEEEKFWLGTTRTGSSEKRVSNLG